MQKKDLVEDSDPRAWTMLRICEMISGTWYGSTKVLQNEYLSRRSPITAKGELNGGCASLTKLRARRDVRLRSPSYSTY